MTLSKQLSSSSTRSFADLAIRDEPDAPIIPSEFFAFDGKNLGREDLKREIYDELIRP